VHFALENYARKEYKDVKKNRSFRSGRRMMLAAGFVLMLQAMIYLVLYIRLIIELIADGSFGQVAAEVILSFVLLLAQLAIGILGYKVWKDPTKKMILVGFISGIVLFLLTVIPMLFEGVSFADDSLLTMSGSIIVFVITVVYVLGSVIVFAGRKHAVLGKRPKIA
jgi:hypothetical protein